ncbi:MAG: holo-[acyl-carrier-protein] synthase, partial [Candidatus Zixiibacteriota bacterium]
IDLVETERIAGLLNRFGERFEARILGREERRLLSSRVDRAAFVAGRFAAKEAAIKALGRYLQRRPAWRELTIVNDAGGMPHLRWADKWQQPLASVEAMVSIAHERSHAIAIVMLTEKT